MVYLFCYVRNMFCMLVYPFQEPYKKQKALLLLHVSKRMTNNNTVQYLAVLLDRAHVSGIFVQTCGCSLGESMSHSSVPPGWWRCVRPTCAQSRWPSCPCLIRYFPLCNATAGNKGTVPQRPAWVSLCVTCNDHYLTRHPSLWKYVDLRHRM